MWVRMIVEGLVVVIPCLGGLVDIGRTILASGGRVAGLDLGRLADTLSLWALVAAGGFCVVRGIGNAVSPRVGQIAAYEQGMARVLMVLIGFGGLLVCEPIGDRAEMWFRGAVQGVASTPSLTAAIGYAGWVIQLAVASLLVAGVVKVWVGVSARCLGLHYRSPVPVGPGSLRGRAPKPRGGNR